MLVSPRLARDDDRNVACSESVDLAQAVAKRGVEFEQFGFSDEVRGVLLYRNWVAASNAALDFLDRKLGAGPGARATPGGGR